MSRRALNHSDFQAGAGTGNAIKITFHKMAQQWCIDWSMSYEPTTQIWHVIQFSEPITTHVARFSPEINLKIKPFKSLIRIGQ